MPSLFASATQDNKNGDLILKVVNGNEQSLDTRVDFQGAKKLAGTGREIVLASDKPTDENTLANPTKVSPKSRPWEVTGPSFHHAFPGNSVTILRIGARSE